MSKHRGHKQHEVEDIGGYMVSDFSNLPDCIVHHILSLMPIKEAVKTSVLSTRWKNLWAFVPNIDFNDKVLCARVVDGSYEESQIHSWISDAIMHNVEELDLNLGGDPSMMPWSILDRTSLVSLKISQNLVSELPSCISFPCLKTLHLLLVMFPSDDHAQKLLLGCPVLEELVLLDIWMNLKNIVISCSTLKSLTIRDILMFEAYNDPTNGCKIKIDAANLTYFDYFVFLSNEILLNNNASSLVKACINILPHAKQQKLVASRAVNLLKRLQSVSNPAIESHVCR